MEEEREIRSEMQNWECKGRLMREFGIGRRMRLMSKEVLKGIREIEREKESGC